ncbi:MAG: glycosyltransferase [Clostridium butyricum]|uniref:glycosyltransferase family 2 protein n=1 Tax=Clostridium sp. TaxID=1506 RepID=UPI002904BDE5|nr:glycosyltransferase [Clostridium sp.]MDU1339599.1 glycosyltransferase [Clostridium butyricum]MDU4589343.1 glycosyltransferase [Clostridium sp.]
MIIINIEHGDSVEVSVIVITYNQENYIREALDSILMQNVSFKYEVLVGDDASTDDTQKILNEYAQKYPDLFKIILRKENIGATQNIYELLCKANGRYLATLEGDDYWTDEKKLQIQYQFMQENSEYIGCTHEFDIVNKNSSVIKNQKLNWIKQKSVFTIDDFDGITLPGQLGTWFFKNVFKGNKYVLITKVHRLISDRTIMMILLFNGKFKLINKKMSSYRSFTEVDNSAKCTNMLYKNNVDRIKQEINITKKNEEIALVYFNKKVEFFTYRMQIFSDAIILFFKHPCKKSLISVYEAFAYTNNKLKATIYIPINLFKKLYYKL